MRIFSRRSVKMPTLPTAVSPSKMSAPENDTGTGAPVRVDDVDLEPFDAPAARADHAA